MELTPSERLIVSMKFDSYIKKCCKNELRNIEKYNKRIRRREISVPELTGIKALISKKDIEYPDFVINGYDIAINDSRLFDALSKLEDRERELILLLFFMGFKPGNISKELNVGERTVYNHKKKILGKLKEMMEEKND